MSRCVTNNAHLLRALAKMSPKRRKVFLKAADKELIQSICECALNTLKGNVPLQYGQKRSLTRYKRILRKLVKSKCSWKSKKKFLIQKGSGFLPALLVPIIGSILSNLITN